MCLSFKLNSSCPSTLGDKGLVLHILYLFKKSENERNGLLYSHASTMLYSLQKIFRNCLKSCLFISSCTLVLHMSYTCLVIVLCPYSLLRVWIEHNYFLSGFFFNIVPLLLTVTNTGAKWNYDLSYWEVKSDKN